VTRRDLEAVIGRAMLHEAFRHLLFAEPETALTGYELTEAEVAVLKSADAESLDACAILLGSRMRWSLPRNETVTEKSHTRGDT
jgi:hypothetical protein